MTNKVSIVTVSFNCISSIEDTILSVVCQNYEYKEFIIIDGGSTDGTLDIIKKYKEKIDYWISEKDAGIYDAMNKGINVSNGEWIIFMNSGDLFYNSNVLGDVFNQNSYGEEIIYGDRISLFSFGKYYHKPAKLSTFNYDFPIFHQSTFVKLDLLKYRGFNTIFKICADYESFYHFFSTGHSFRYLPIPFSICECEEGFSSRPSSQLRRISENARITNMSKYSFVFMKQYLKTVFRVVLFVFFDIMGHRFYNLFYKWRSKFNSRITRLT